MHIILSSRVSDVNFSEIKMVKVEISELEARQEIMWKQRAIIDWVQEGDKNTNFFHSYASSRRRTNKIQQILDEQGNWVVSEAEIIAFVTNYFVQIFSSSNPASADYVLALIEPKVTE